MSATRARHAPAEVTVNAAAWLAWFVAAALVPIVSRNPLYLTLGLLVVLAVYLATPRRGSLARAWRVVLAIGTTLAVFSIGFNVLTVHSGDAVFARLPGSLPIVGGPLTWNALVYGATSALAIATLLLAAATFSSAVRQADLIRLLPSRVATLGVAATVAMTLIPQTIAAARDIYDAQRSRGHRFRGVRDARSLLVPLLGAGLERSLVLAEALETRGFGGSATPQAARRRPLPLAGAGLAVVAALGLVGFGHVPQGAGALLLALVLAATGAPAHAARSRFRPLVWDLPSLAVAGAAVGAVSLTMLALLQRALAYDPFPRLAAPPFDPVAGGAILLLLVPALWSVR